MGQTKTANAGCIVFNCHYFIMCTLLYSVVYFYAFSVFINCIVLLKIHVIDFLGLP